MRTKCSFWIRISIFNDSIRSEDIVTSDAPTLALE